MKRGSRQKHKHRTTFNFVQVFFSIQVLLKREKYFQGNSGTLHTQINASGLIILTHKLSVHTGKTTG